ncbi:MAG TPA: hypothetical protein VGD81_20680 [Opitutaceae bacterium]
MTPKPAPPPPDPSDWDNLVQRARRDVSAPVDLAALLRVVRAAASPAPVPTFLGEFAALFATRRAMTVCAAAALACMVLAGWQSWSAWEELSPWAEFSGGAWEIML